MEKNVLGEKKRENDDFYTKKLKIIHFLIF